MTDEDPFAQPSGPRAERQKATKVMVETVAGRTIRYRQDKNQKLFDSDADRDWYVDGPFIQAGTLQPGEGILAAVCRKAHEQALRFWAVWPQRRDRDMPLEDGIARFAEAAWKAPLPAAGLAILRREIMAMACDETGRPLRRRRASMEPDAKTMTAYEQAVADAGGTPKPGRAVEFMKQVVERVTGQPVPDFGGLVKGIPEAPLDPDAWEDTPKGDG